MLVLPDVRGLHDFYRELTHRFAEAGIDAVAIDYFARTAADDDRGEGFDWKPLLEQTPPQAVDMDARAGAAWLRSPAGGAVTSVFTVGFCYGGSTSWRQSATLPGVAGCIGFYGVPARVAEHVADFRAPILVMAAGEDFTPPAVSQQFADDARAHVESEMVLFEGAPHSFFDRTFAEHREACDEAWRRMLDFVAKHRA